MHMRFISKVFVLRFFTTLSLPLIITSCFEQRRVILHSAIYQCNESQKFDVSEIVQKNLLITKQGDKIIDLTRFKSLNEAFGDPQPGCSKYLKLSYYFGPQNREVELIILEHEFGSNKLILLRPL
jgi:hypothetical protein